MRITYLTIFWIFLLTLAVLGQDQTSEENVCNDEIANSLVAQLVAESRSVAETDKRVRILTRSADFLWKFDQPTAREYFAEAFNVARDRYAEKGLETKKESNLTVQLPDYRFEVIKAIAKHDGEWAKRLSEELLKEYEKEAANRSEWDKNREVAYILQIAVEAAQSNPALSWYLYRRVMREPLDFHWMWALYNLREKNGMFADQLYAELIRNYANESPRKLLFLSAYPWGRGTVFGYDRTSFGTSSPAGFNGSLPLQISFIDLFLRRADAYVSDPSNFNLGGTDYRPSEAAYIISALIEMEPFIAQSNPAFVPRVTILRSKAMAMLRDVDRKKMDDRDKFADSLKTPFEERIAELERADSEGRLDDAMILAVMVHSGGLKQEEQFKIFEPWLDKVRDSDARSQMVNFFWFLRTKLAIKENRFAEADAFAKKVPEIEHRAVLLFEIAEVQLKNLANSSDAYQTLAEVSRMNRQAEDSLEKARVLLGLASLYEKLNHSFAISELSDAVTVINKLKDVDLMTSGVIRQITTKNMSYFSMYDMPGANLETTFQLLSKNDYSLTLSNARAIGDRYYRTIAVLAIAKNCANRSKPKTAAKPK